MFNHHVKDDKKEKKNSAFLTINHAHFCHYTLIFLTKVPQAKASTSF